MLAAEFLRAAIYSQCASFVKFFLWRGENCRETKKCGVAKIIFCKNYFLVVPLSTFLTRC
jgi:hypothetical protein